MDTLSKLKLITKIIREARDDLALDNLRAFAKEKLRESEKVKCKLKSTTNTATLS